MVEKWFTLNSLLGRGDSGGGGGDGDGVTGPAALLPSATSRIASKRASHSAGGGRRTPSVLLEISFSRPETLDESEDEADFGDEDDEESVAGVDNEAATVGDDALQATDHEDRSRLPANEHSSISMSGEGVDMQHTLKTDDGPETDPITGQEIDVRNNGPFVKPGVVDFLAVVGCRDIGDQTNDDGSKGWVNSTPECCVLEQYPIDNEFHVKNGR